MHAIGSIAFEPFFNKPLGLTYLGPVYIDWSRTLKYPGIFLLVAKLLSLT